MFNMRRFFVGLVYVGLHHFSGLKIIKMSISFYFLYLYYLFILFIFFFWWAGGGGQKNKYVLGIMKLWLFLWGHHKT